MPNLIEHGKANLQFIFGTGVADPKGGGYVLQVGFFLWLQGSRERRHCRVSVECNQPRRDKARLCVFTRRSRVLVPFVHHDRCISIHLSLLHRRRPCRSKLSFHNALHSLLITLSRRSRYVHPTLQISNSHLPHGLAVFAFSFNVTVTPALAALPPSELLNFTFSAPIDSCQSLCSDAGSVITTCTSSAQAATPSPDGTPDPASGCLCSDSTVASLLNCEQCIYTAQIAANVPRSDPRAGSQPLLAGVL